MRGAAEEFYLCSSIHKVRGRSRSLYEDINIKKWLQAMRWISIICRAQCLQSKIFDFEFMKCGDHSQLRTYQVSVPFLNWTSQTYQHSWARELLVDAGQLHLDHVWRCATPNHGRRNGEWRCSCRCSSCNCCSYHRRLFLGRGSYHTIMPMANYHLPCAQRRQFHIIMWVGWHCSLISCFIITLAIHRRLLIN